MSNATSKDMSDKRSTHWTHAEKGGLYIEIAPETAPALGSGDLHGEELVVYFSPITKRYYVRKVAEWAEKMKPISIGEANRLISDAVKAGEMQ